MDECAECQAKYETWLAARKEVTRQPEVPAAMLMEQRQRILERSGQPLGSFWHFLRWSPAMAMAAMALAAVLWMKPGTKPVAAVEAPAVVETAQASDTQVLADIYKTAYDVEPQAVVPLHGLFEDKGQAND